jgi:hypothetical protein
VNRAQVDELEQALERSSRAAADLFARHGEAQLRRRPGHGGWSAAECIVHLSLTSAAALPLVEAALADLEARGARRAGRSRMDPIGAAINWSLKPGRFRVKTGAAFTPQETGPFAAVLPGFLKWQERAVAVLRRMEGLDVGRAKITSPFVKGVRYNVLSTLRILETHERRHLAQAARAVGDKEAPG